MSTQDEDNSSKNNGAYQFFSHDSYSSYFGDQNSTAANSDLSAFTSSFSAADYTTSLAVPVPNIMDVLPVQIPGDIGSLETAPIGSTNYSDSNLSYELSTPTVVPQVPPAPVVPQVLPEPVAPPVYSLPVYSLKDDTPEPTFEERVAAMKKAVAEKSVAEQGAAPNVVKIPAAPATAALNIPSSATSVTSSVTDGMIDDGWHAYQPHQIASTQSQESQESTPNTFSTEFDINRSLLKIFWRIDIDHNNRVSKKELAYALDNNWFSGDEKVLAKILFFAYEDISPEAIFCDAGLSVTNILSYAPFSEFVNASSSWELAESNSSVSNKSANQQKKTTSQSLRWTKNRR